mmetsp:Transcript_20216/g.47508  ORF Transcript_20216/g.47508 Transcript_20216/m.47508 type:complete len:222 (-) Transcript_20216:193-858(-)
MAMSDAAPHAWSETTTARWCWWSPESSIADLMSSRSARSAQHVRSIPGGRSRRADRADSLSRARSLVSTASTSTLLLLYIESASARSPAMDTARFPAPQPASMTVVLTSLPQRRSSQVCPLGRDRRPPPEPACEGPAPPSQESSDRQHCGAPSRLSETREPARPHPRSAGLARAPRPRSTLAAPRCAAFFSASFSSISMAPRLLLSRCLLNLMAWRGGRCH